MIDQQQAEEIAARYRAMGARDCTAETVMKFLGPTPEEQSARLSNICARFGMTRGELMETINPKILKALEVARCYAGIDGAHHKAWVIDQMVRALTGDGYAEWVEDYCAGEDGPCTYEWDEGIAP